MVDAGAVVVRDLDHAVVARTGIAVVVAAVVAVGNVLTELNMPWLSTIFQPAAGNGFIMIIFS